MKHVLSAFFFASTLAACAGAPRSNTAGLDRREFQERGVVAPAESVPIVTSDDDQVGVVDVATSGAFYTQLGHTHGTPVIHVRLTVRNVDVNPIKVPLDQIQLESTFGQPVHPAAVFSTERKGLETSIIVPPGQATDIDCVFVLPADTRIDKVPGFFVSWGVDTATDSVREKTAFRPAGQQPNATVAKAFRPYHTL